MKSPVLIVIDMLNDFLAGWEATEKQRLIQAVAELVDVMRAHSFPIVWVRQEFDADLHDAFAEMRVKGIRTAIRGTPGCQIVPELTPASAETVIVKKRYSAFFQTNLDEILGRLRPDAVILAGINTHACIRTTAIDAYQRDWPVVLALDCIDSYDREHHDVSLRYMKDKIATVLTNREIASLLPIPQ